MTIKEIAEKLYNDDNVVIEIPEYARDKGEGYATAWIADVRVGFFWDENFGIHDETIEILE